MTGDIQFRFLQMEDLVKIEALQKTIREITEPHILQTLSREEWMYILDHGKWMIGVFAGERLIACRALVQPADRQELLGEDAKLPENAWDYVLHSEISFVHPEFRGNGLQTIMGEKLMQEVDASKYAYICATVAPFNIASMKDKLALGFEIVNLKEKYNSHLRYIFLKRLGVSAEPLDGEMKVLPMGEIEEQKELLRDQWVGKEVVKENDHWFVRYLKV